MIPCERIYSLKRFEGTRKWSVDGALSISENDRYYIVDPATQDGTRQCLERLENGEYVMLMGPRASGKTTRLIGLMSELQTKFFCIMCVLQPCMRNNFH
jgi:hypothetical protein